MRGYGRLRLGFLWLLGALGGIGPWGVGMATQADELPQTLRISSGEFPPWSSEQLPHGGYVNQIVQEAFGNQGIAVEFVYLPWRRAFEEARQGKFDATSYWFTNTERRETMLFSEPLVLNRTVFFQRAEDRPIEWNTFDDLSPYKLSATIGFTYTEEFYAAIAQDRLKPVMVPSDLQNLKLLIAKRTDLFATDEMSGYFMAAQLSLDPRKLRVVKKPMVEHPGYLLVSRLHPQADELLRRFNQGLANLKKSGRYTEIMNRIDNSSFYNPQTE